MAQDMRVLVEERRQALNARRGYLLGPVLLGPLQDVAHHGDLAKEVAANEHLPGFAALTPAIILIPGLLGELGLEGLGVVPQRWPAPNARGPSTCVSSCLSPSNSSVNSSDSVNSSMNSSDSVNSSDSCDGPRG